MGYSLETMEFSRKRIATFLSMKNSDRVKLSGFSTSTWSRWLSAERHPPLNTLEEVAKALRVQPGLESITPWEVAAGLLILRKPTHP